MWADLRDYTPTVVDLGLRLERLLFFYSFQRGGAVGRGAWGVGRKDLPKSQLCKYFTEKITYTMKQCSGTPYSPLKNIHGLH